MIHQPSDHPATTRNPSIQSAKILSAGTRLASGCLASSWENDSEQLDTHLSTDQQPDANAFRLIKTKPRVLTTVDKSFFALLNKKTWIAYSQPTPPHLKGADQIINYLSRYVSGSVISDQRILTDDGNAVTIRIKDYKAGDVKDFTLSGGEFVRRWAKHILPKHLSRVRYCGILAACDREERLTLCRKLINESRNRQLNNQIKSDAICTLPALPPFELEDEYIEDEPPLPKCHCRY